MGLRHHPDDMVDAMAYAFEDHPMPITLLSHIPTAILEAELQRRQQPDPLSPVELLRALASTLGIEGGDKLHLPIAEDADSDLTPAATETPAPSFLRSMVDAAIREVNRTGTTFDNLANLDAALRKIRAEL